MWGRERERERERFGMSENQDILSEKISDTNKLRGQIH